MTCITIGCGKPIENRDTGECSSCGRARRKLENAQLKEPKKSLKKVSEKRVKDNQEYAKLRQKFLLGRWCAVHGKPCIPQDVHHQQGRVGYADEKEIPLLLDTRYWIAVCRTAHEEIERRPEWAKEQGYSYDRLTKKETI